MESGGCRCEAGVVSDPQPAALASSCTQLSALHLTSAHATANAHSIADQRRRAGQCADGRQQLHDAVGRVAG